jgi:hypothetical protein
MVFSLLGIHITANCMRFLVSANNMHAYTVNNRPMYLKFTFSNFDTDWSDRGVAAANFLRSRIYFSELQKLTSVLTLPKEQHMLIELRKSMPLWNLNAFLQIAPARGTVLYIRGIHT